MFSITVFGMPASGKTIAIDDACTPTTNLRPIPDVKHWIRLYPMFPTKVESIEDRDVKQDVLLEIEVARTIYARSVFHLQGFVPVFDNDWLSMLAYSYALSETSHCRKVYQRVVDRTTLAIIDDRLVVPNLWVYVNVPEDERLRRRNGDTRTARNDIFFEASFANAMVRYYDMFADALNKSTVFDIQSPQGDLRGGRLRECFPTDHAGRSCQSADIVKLIAAL